MKLKLLLVSLSVLIFTSSPVFATVIGKIFLQRCNEEVTMLNSKDVSKGYCIGYIAGFLDTYMLTLALHDVRMHNRLFCLPSEGISLGEAVKTSIKYLQDNPNELNQPARNLLVKAFKQSHPCDNN